MTDRPPVVVACRPRDGGWSCRVSVGEPDDALGYEVSVSADELGTLAPDSDPTTLVSESFAFLLEREPREAILRRFELTTISRYFPEYPAEIRARLAS